MNESALQSLSLSPPPPFPVQLVLNLQASYKEAVIPSAYDSKLKFKRPAYMLLILYHSLSRPFNYYLIELQF